MLLHVETIEQTPSRRYGSRLEIISKIKYFLSSSVPSVCGTVWGCLGLSFGRVGLGWRGVFWSRLRIKEKWTEEIAQERCFDILENASYFSDPSSTSGCLPVIICKKIITFVICKVNRQWPAVRHHATRWGAGKQTHIDYLCSSWTHPRIYQIRHSMHVGLMRQTSARKSDRVNCLMTMAFAGTQNWFTSPRHCAVLFD